MLSGLLRNDKLRCCNSISLLSKAPFRNLKTENQIKNFALFAFKIQSRICQNFKLFRMFTFAKIQNLEDQKNNTSNSLRKYGKYSSVVFQMLFIIAIAFWGGHQLDLYFKTGSNVLVLVIGLSGLCLSLYTTLKRLEILNKEENAKQK